MRGRAAAPRAGNRSLTAHHSILSLFRARNVAHVARSERYLRYGVCDKHESDLSESSVTDGGTFCSRRDTISIATHRQHYYTNEIVSSLPLREIFAHAIIFSNFPVCYRPFWLTWIEVD